MKQFGECHAHLFMDGMDYTAAVQRHRNHPDETAIRMALSAYREKQISFVRDGGDHYGVSTYARKLASEYGITYRTPVFAIYHEGNYGRVVGHGYRTMKEYADLVKLACQEGADFIKIMTTGIMTFREAGELNGYSLPADEVREMVHIAHAYGRKVMSHTNGAEGILRAVDAGVDSIEHGNFQNAESIAALTESQTIWVPTIVTIRNLIGCGRFNDTVLRTIYEQAAESVRIAYQKKAVLALGSDAGAYRVMHAQGVLDEYRAFQEITEWDCELHQRLSDAETLVHSFVPDVR